MLRILLLLLLCLSALAQQTRINGSRVIEGTVNYVEDASGTDSYAVTFSPAVTSYVTGSCLTFKATAANTGAASLDVNSLGAKAIKKAVGGVTTDLSDNDIRAGQLVTVCYDGTNYQMMSITGNASTGDVTGPGSSTDNRVVAFNGGTGKVIKDSGVLITNVPEVTGARTAGRQLEFDGDGKIRASSSNIGTGATANQNVRSVRARFPSATELTVCGLVRAQVDITEWTIAANSSGNATIDIRTVAKASWTGPGSASSITASATPSLSSQVYRSSTVFTGWTTSIPADTYVCFVASSVTAGYPIEINLKTSAN